VGGTILSGVGGEGGGRAVYGVLGKMFHWSIPVREGARKKKGEGQEGA